MTNPGESLTIPDSDGLDPHVEAAIGHALAMSFDMRAMSESDVSSKAESLVALVGRDRAALGHALLALEVSSPCSRNVNVSAAQRLLSEALKLCDEVGTSA